MHKGGKCDLCGTDGLDVTIDIWVQGFLYDPDVDCDEQFPTSRELQSVTECEDDYISLCKSCWEKTISSHWYCIVAELPGR